jgi:hypothetical protein
MRDRRGRCLGPKLDTRTLLEFQPLEEAYISFETGPIEKFKESIGLTL